MLNASWLAQVVGPLLLAAIVCGQDVKAIAEPMTLTFEDLAQDGATSGYVSNSGLYHGLIFGNISWVDAKWFEQQVGPTGYTAGIVSPSIVAYAQDLSTYPFPLYRSSITTMDLNTRFDFTSVYITAAYNDGMAVDVIGAVTDFTGDDKITELYRTTIYPSATEPTQYIFGFLGVNEVYFRAYGGTSHGYRNGRTGLQFALDNVVISWSAVPEIDPATGSSAISFVAGVLAIIEHRRRRAALSASA